MSELRARVISQEKGLYQISSGTEVKQASVSGKFRYEAQTVSDYPAVGDYVLAEWQEAGSPAIIRSLVSAQKLLSSESCRQRKAGAGRRGKHRHGLSVHVAQPEFQPPPPGALSLHCV